MTHSPDLYGPEHEDFRRTARTFFEREVTPHHDQWERDGIVPRELQNRLATQGVQLHGGFGCMREYPIAKAFPDSRVSTIYGGPTEIEKEIIGRSLGI